MPQGTTRVSCGFMRVLLFAFCILVAVLPAQAQLDPGNFDIFQRGKKVGEIYVPARALEQTHYVEHWVLFGNYVYPDGTPSLMIRIKPSKRVYTSEEDFFARVPWGPGFRYVRIDATDTDRLPGQP